MKPDERKDDMSGEPDDLVLAEERIVELEAVMRHVAEQRIVASMPSRIVLPIGRARDVMRHRYCRHSCGYMIDGHCETNVGCDCPCNHPGLACETLD